MRNSYNLSHIAHLAGHIGRIQTISTIPVIPGDSLEINLDGIIRLAPTRKEIVSECQVDICAFYVKHRHVYGDTAWTDAIRAGPQATNPFTGIAVASAYRDPFYLGIHSCGATVNAALLRGYNFIMSRYFFVPSINGNAEYTVAQNNWDFYPTVQTWASNMRKYGALAARLPHILNGFNALNNTTASGANNNLTQADWGVQIPDTAPNVGLLDIRNLAEIKSRYKTVQDANWFAQFYTDVLEKRWNTDGVNSDADKRPDYLGRTTQMLSGQDVNGTDDATLGSFVGKTLDRVNFSMPRRFFPEHGNVWIMAVLRFPMLHTREQHPLLVNPTPDWNLLTADPTLVNAQEPVPFDPAQWIAGGSAFGTDPNVQQPYGQEYRYQPNRVHPNYAAIPGYPFSAWDSATIAPWLYYFNEEYKETFQTSQIGQWQAHMRVNATKLSSLPNPVTSIYAGA